MTWGRGQYIHHFLLQHKLNTIFLGIQTDPIPNKITSGTRQGCKHASHSSHITYELPPFCQPCKTMVTLRLGQNNLEKKHEFPSPPTTEKNGRLTMLNGFLPYLSLASSCCGNGVEIANRIKESLKTALIRAMKYYRRS